MPKDQATLDQETLKKIASAISYIPIDDMTELEKNIARLLRDHGLLVHNATDNTYQIEK